ncbi:hypothetical protein [Winogradskyella sp.]|uniref:hypothetical protein n=1 Tax=Winogradskyella sp. TaxID=1883156 RepID=UPI003AB5FFC4
MKEVYIAYFDFLGFKEFILNNDDVTLMRRMNHIFRDIEWTLGQGKRQPPRSGMIFADLSNSKINCLNISDTVVFWTNDTTSESLKDLFDVAYEFNWKENTFNFPVRGCITKGKLSIVKGNHSSKKGGSYSLSCLYGEGIIRAHTRAESQNWAGTVVDDIILKDFKELSEAEDFLKDYALKYKVPYKNGNNLNEEFVLRFSKGKLNYTAYENMVKDIYRVFQQDNKPTDHPSVQCKLENTVKFLKEYR